MRKMSQNAVKRLCTACTKAESSRGKGSRRQTRPRRPMRRRRAWKEGRAETAGSSYSLLTLPASLSSRRQAERTSDDRAGCFCGVFELFVQTVNKYILYYSRRLLLHGQASKHEQRVARFMVSASSSDSRPLHYGLFHKILSILTEFICRSIILKNALMLCNFDR